MPLTTKECNQVFPTWTAEHQAEFENIKHLVLGANCLTVIDYEDKELNIYVNTDASDHCTGAVLSLAKIGKQPTQSCTIPTNSMMPKKTTLFMRRNSLPSSRC
jgi:RNase H-like domain found in reverse transcriptase